VPVWLVRCFRDTFEAPETDTGNIGGGCSVVIAIVGVDGVQKCKFYPYDVMKQLGGRKLNVTFANLTAQLL